MGPQEILRGTLFLGRAFENAFPQQLRLHEQDLSLRETICVGDSNPYSGFCFAHNMLHLIDVILSNAFFLLLSRCKREF